MMNELIDSVKRKMMPQREWSIRKYVKYQHVLFMASLILYFYLAKHSPNVSSSIVLFLLSPQLRRDILTI